MKKILIVHCKLYAIDIPKKCALIFNELSGWIKRLEDQLIPLVSAGGPIGIMEWSGSDGFSVFLFFLLISIC